MIRFSRKLILLPVVAAYLCCLPACDNEGPGEKAGEKLDKAAEKAGDAVEDAGDKIKDATE